MQFVELTQNYSYWIIGLVHRKQQSCYYMMRLTAQQIFPLLKMQLFNCPKYNFSLKVLGLTPLFGDRCGFMPPQLKTNKNNFSLAQKHNFFCVQFFNVLLPRAIFMALGRCQRCSKSNVYSFFPHFHSTSTVYFYSVQCTVGTKYYLQ